jgi:hypothetical protein
MFFVLGLKNAWRNRARTALGIVSMAVAAMLFLSSATLSKGYPAAAFFPARQLMGGDILLIPGKNAISREDMAGGYTWRFGAKSLDNPNPAMGFDTIPYSYGTTQGFPTSGAARMPANRYQQALAALRANPAVRYAAVRRSLPFIVRAASSYAYGFLDARDIGEDLSTWQMESAIVSGSYLKATDEGLAGVSVTGWAGLQMPRTGAANLEIPRYTAVAKDDASTFLDYENPAIAAIQMKGAATFTEGGGAEARTLSAPAVFVSPSTLESLATAAGFPAEATYWGISVSLKDMATSENVAALLRREFRDFTVLPASQLTAAAVSRSAISAGVPMDMRRITEGIAFVTAALLSATNLTVLMLSRKNEIGILRALGATRLNIATMVLTESVWISLLGAVLGGLLTQPAIIWQLLSNKVGSDVMLAEVGSGLGKAVAFAAVSAALFGFLPVAKALRVTPAQVLRGE